MPNDTNYIRVVNELPEIIDSHNAHLAHFPKKSANPLELKLAYQVRNSAKAYQWGNSHNISRAGVGFSKYGYRRNEDETDRFDKDIAVEEDDDDEDEEEADDDDEEEEEEEEAEEEEEGEDDDDDASGGGGSSDEYNSEGIIREEEEEEHQQQRTMEREEAELEPEDINSLEEDDNI